VKARRGLGEAKEEKYGREGDVISAPRILCNGHGGWQESVRESVQGGISQNILWDLYLNQHSTADITMRSVHCSVLA